MNLESALLQSGRGVGGFPFVERLSIAPYLKGNRTLNLDNPEWDKAGFRVCILQPGHLEPKLMSHTLTQLVALMRQGEARSGEKWYIDFAFRPPQRDCADLRKKGIPEVFGWTSLRELSEFDVLCCSFSVHYESASILAVLWGGGIEPFYHKRGQNDPFIMAGGVMAQYLECLCGHPDGAFCDLICLGEGEGCLPLMLWALCCQKANLRKNRDTICEWMVRRFDNLYWPDAYIHEYEGAKLVNIRAKYDWNDLSLGKVEYYRNENPESPIFEDRLLLTDNDHAGRAALRISQGCSGAGCCAFCTEGSEAGAWREHPYKHITKQFNKLIGKCAPNVISYYAYNLNFHSDYVKLMQVASERFASQSVIAFRADVVAETPGYIRFMKRMGVNRITIALEGISERMRVFLNKNVTWEHFFKVADQVFAEDIGVLKVNLIVTGYETEADYAEFVEQVERFLQLRKERHSRVKLSFSATILVTYWNTALQWEGRRSIVEAMHTDKVYRLFERCRALGVGVKLHSGHEYTFQQLMIDAGRAISVPVVEWYREVWEQNKALFYPFEELNNRIFEYLGITDREAYFLRPRGYDELNPTSSYNVIPEATKQLWWERKGKGYAYCLKTASNQHPVCHNCGLCSDTQRRRILNRNLELNLDVPLKRNLPRSTARVLYQVASNDFARCRHKLVLCHSIAGKLIQNAKLEEQFHSVCNYSDEGIVANNQCDVWDGFGMFDIDFRCSVDTLQGVRWGISDFDDARVISVHVSDKNASEVKYGSVWRFYAQYSPDVLSERMADWNGDVVVRVQTESTVIQNGVIHLDKEKLGLCLGIAECGSVGYMYLDNRTNPLMVLSSIFKIPLLHIKSEFRVTRMALYTDGIGICKRCGGLSSVSVISHRTDICGKCACKLFSRR